MNKKVNVLIVLSFLFILVIGGSYAYSKYRTDTSGIAEADIANWNILVNGCNIIKPDKTNKSCFESNSSGGKVTIIKNFDTSEFVYDTTSSFTKVDKLAPGTGGSFIIRIRPNDTQVSIKYTLKVDRSKIDNDSIKVYRSDPMSSVNFHKNNIKTYDKNILLEENGLTKIIPYSGDVNYEEVIVIYIKWDDLVSSDNDVKDTEIGTNTNNPKLEFPISILFEQYKG